MLRSLLAPLFVLGLLLAPSPSQGEEARKDEASPAAGKTASPTSEQAPCPEAELPLRLMQPDEICRKQDKVTAEKIRDNALNGDPVDFLLLVALSTLERPNGGASLFGAPASFWKEWLIRLFGEKEGCYLLACILHTISATPGLPQTEINRIVAEYLRKSVALGHPEAMYGLARLPQVEARALELLRGHLAANGADEAVDGTARLEVLEADSFATLDDGGYGARDMRVSCQVVPGIAGRLTGTAGDGVWN